MLKRVSFLTCVLLTGAGHLFAQTTTGAFTLVPQSAPANQSFTLTLKNPRFGCATNYSEQTVTRNGNNLYLGFKAVNDTNIHCPKSDSMFGPSFSIPPLTAGSDSVYAVQQPACAPLCALPVRQEFAGILTVYPVKDSAWFIQPRQTAANKPFTLQLLSYAYGNCQTTFTHTSLDTGNHSLYASFVVENHPERVCVADIRPYGPSYPISGLKAGKYAVYAEQHFACEYTTPRCLIAIRPVLVDTLSVVLPGSLIPDPPAIHHPMPLDHLGIVQGFWVNGRKAVSTPGSR